MRRAFLILSAALLMICAACSSSSKVEGTWYSVTDATMYNFQDKKITVSGVTVGQYEDNGDSVVISMMDTGSNLQLYVTKMDGVEVLADVKQGEGTYYFCRGLEAAQSFVKEAENRIFQEYVEENLCGTWLCIDDDSDIEYIEIAEDHKFTVHSRETYSPGYWSNLRFDTLEDGRFCAVLDLADNDKGENAWQLPIFQEEHTYDRDRLYFGELIMRKLGD